MLPCQGRCRRFDPGLPLQTPLICDTLQKRFARRLLAGCCHEARYPSGKGEVCKTFMRRFDPDPRLQRCNTTRPSNSEGFVMWRKISRKRNLSGSSARCLHCIAQDVPERCYPRERYAVAGTMIRECDLEAFIAWCNPDGLGLCCLARRRLTQMRKEQHAASVPFTRNRRDA